MSSFGGIPFNQAPGTRQDERIGRVQDQASRARELPARDAWVLGSVPMGLVLADQQILSAELIRFYYLGQFQKELHLKQARLNITTAAASQTVRTALYRYDTGENLTGAKSVRRLVKQADSEAKFLATSAGVQTITLPDGAAATPGAIFLGVKASNDAVGVGGVAQAAVSRAMPFYTFQDQVGVLAPVVDFPALTKSYTGVLLDVLYISPDAAQVL